MRELLHPEAREEWFEALRYYEDLDHNLGVRFHSEIERLIREVCGDPERFRKFDPPARRNFSRNFPYAVIYLEKPDHLWSVAVMHTKREPGYWRSRL